jgi:uncharacterized RDD family membrane protein YckC
MARARTWINIIGMFIVMTGRALATGIHDDDQRMVICASSREHLWFVSKSRDGFNLCHCASDVPSLNYRPLALLTTEPSALAAWGARVWIVFPSTPGSMELRRETFTLQATYNAALDWYDSEPSGRLEVAPSLPGTGILSGFVGTAAGPLALLVPPQWARVSVKTEGRADDARDVLQKPRLLQLVADQWRPVDLPAALSGDGSCWLAAIGAEGRQVLILEQPPDNPDVGQFFILDPRDNQWSKHTIAQNLRDLRLPIGVGNQAVIALQTDRSHDIRLGYLRDSGLLELANHQPIGRWGLFGVSGEIQLLESRVDATWAVRSIAPLTGEIGRETVLPMQPLGDRLWRIALYLGLVLASLLLVFLMRPDPNAALTIPAGARLMPIGSRGVALAIDMIPAALVVTALLQCQPEDLLISPIVMFDLGKGAPYLLTVGLTVLHSTITEAATSTTLGKAMMGARVVTLSGERPGLLSHLMRNGLKLITLVCPPLALMAFLNPRAQGIGDLLAGMVVVQSIEQPRSDDAQD